MSGYMNQLTPCSLARAQPDLTEQEGPIEHAHGVCSLLMLITH